ncbi:MAG TPA: response regulator transcription factor [Tenuifilaceae bacterium]|nr:response regulator transcription factor [Tenuifilaceae bacterium]HPJ45930.1 response regulator transcription factor [Tenuifilaceae bacterium]HRX67329.1 response regulator transcription factor [Tenuifilaceae bacterium]
MMSTLKIAIVDDHEMFRSGIKLILAQNQQWQVVIEAVNGEDFLLQLNHTIPDIVLLDMSMPILDGYQTTKQALTKYPDLKIIILTMHSEEQYYFQMIEAGVKAFILKKSGTEELFRAIDEVAKGNNYFDQELLKSIVLRFNRKEVDDKLHLNAREKEVLHYICNGFTNNEISCKLFLSTKTIEKYRTSLLQKTNTRNSAHLVMFAIQNRLIELS